MTTSASRAPIDFDAFERDLRQASLPQPGTQAPARGDPLAELARIVGQDDPFRALLESHQSPSATGPAQGLRKDGRIEPAFFDAPPAHHESAAQAAYSPADAFDQYLATVEQGTYAEGDEHDPAAFEDPGMGYRAVAAKRPRKSLLQVGAGLGVLVLCVTGALGWKFTRSSGSNGEPVTVLADKTPLKVAPQAADGVEIPDQNKQIYERAAKDGPIKIVNREEQPLDVAQAARSAARDGAGGATTPGNTAILTDSLGEPRRVRTVSVKPDTPVPAAQQRDAAANSVGGAPASPIPTMTMPGTSDATASTPAAAPAPHLSRTLASTPATAKPAPVQTADASGSAQPIPVSSSAPAPRKAAQRVAALSPETTASTDDAPAAAPAPSPTDATASVGGFSVQIGVRASEADARAAFKQMQTKYSQLSGKPELIRQAEVGGKSIYRVRVGPLAKNEATSLCTELKGAGGQCFVAKN